MTYSQPTFDFLPPHIEVFDHLTVARRAQLETSRYVIVLTDHMAGRGGAGNILAVQQSERVAEDVEANRSEKQVPVEPLDFPDSTREEQQYAYTGRGGAGNYYVPKELEKTGHFNNAHRSHILGDGTLAPDAAGGRRGGKSAPIQVTRWQGRGGAGNYAVGAAENEERAAKQKLEEEQQKEAGIKADIAKGVEKSLAMPAKARLAGSHME